MFTPIQQWIPDADDSIPGVLIDVEEMEASTRGYQGAKKPIDAGLDALAAECRGAAHVYLLDGTSALFAGTQTKLYLLNSTSRTDVTDTGGDYTGSSLSRWRFAQQGNLTLAVNKVDPSQYYLTGTSTDFDALAGMPKALCVEAVGNFILIANYDDGTNTADGWACSAIGDYTDWTPDLDTQCVYGRLYDTPGAMTGLIRLMDYACFFKRRSLYLARYVGLPEVWQFALVSDHIGAVSQESIVRAGNVLYFRGEDNFYAYDSANVSPIGDQIREWFNDNHNPAKLDLIRATHDQERGTIRWYYPSKTSAVIDSWISYNYRNQKWGRGTGTMETTIQFVDPGTTYDGIDTEYASYTAINESGWTYDGLTRAGSAVIPAIVGAGHVVQIIRGISDSCSMTSNLIGQDSGITLLTRVRMRYGQPPTTAEMINFYTDQIGSQMTEDFTIEESSGKFDLLRSARWHKLKMSFTGDVEVIGADITMQAEGLE